MRSTSWGQNFSILPFDREDPAGYALLIYDYSILWILCSESSGVSTVMASLRFSEHPAEIQALGRQIRVETIFTTSQRIFKVQ